MALTATIPLISHTGGEVGKADAAPDDDFVPELPEPFVPQFSVSATRDSADADLTDADIVRLAEAADGGHLAQTSRHLGAYCLWATEIQPAIQALLDAQSARAKHPRETLCSALGLSLVLYEAAVSTDADESNKRIVLIQWTIGGKRGRIADLDSDSCVKTIVPTGAKKNPLDLSSSYIIHPAVGVSMERVKRRERPKLPSIIIRLTSMWRTALQSQYMTENQALQILNRMETVDEARSSGTLVESVQHGATAQALLQSESACAFCGTNLHKQRQHEPHTSSSQCSSYEPDFIQQCCICLLSWHMSCVQHLLTCVQPQPVDPLPTTSVSQIQAQPTSVTYTIADPDSDDFTRSIRHTLAFHPEMNTCELPESFRLAARSEQEDDRRTEGL